MISTAVLLALLLIATVTDIRQRRIYNWTTYSGILIALLLNLLATLMGSRMQLQGTQSDWLGAVGIDDSAQGLLACGGVMLVCYVFFAGGLGGGDVKLIAMVGAFLGVYGALEAMLWTFVLAACMALMSLVWRVGFVRLVTRSLKYVLFWLRLGATFPLTDEDRKPLRTKLHLAPSALAAVLIVRFRLMEWF